MSTPATPQQPSLPEGQGNRPPGTEETIERTFLAPPGADPRCCTRWTLVGAPALTLPTGLGPGRLPLGTQLVGRVGRDRELLEAALWLESVQPGPADPPGPQAANRSYSWIRPPSRSRRTTSPLDCGG